MKQKTLLKNNTDFLKELSKAEQGDKKARKVVIQILAPRKDDTIEQLTEKRTIFKRLFYLKSLRYADAPYHYEIRKVYAENSKSILEKQVPKWKNILVIGFRESAKTTEIMINEVYDIIYHYDYFNLINVSAYDNKPMTDIITDIFEGLLLSKISLYIPNLIKTEFKKIDKERQTMADFKTTTGVRYKGYTIRTTKRGARDQTIDEETGEIEMVRPIKNIFEDFENEATIESIPITEKVREVMLAAMAGLDQAKGVNIFSANLLSNQGNVKYFMEMAKSDPEHSKLILIPIIKDNKPYWPAKYVMTDAEATDIKISIETLRRNTPNFDTEFMLNPSEDESYFNLQELKKQEQLVKEPELVSGEFKMFYRFNPSGRYAGGMDISKGIGRDSSTSVFIDFSTIPARVVATYKNNKINPTDFGDEIARQGHMLGTCLVAPENNYETATLLRLSQVYPTSRIYKQSIMKYIKARKIKTEVLGWNTNKMTKSKMLAELREAIDKGWLQITDQDLIDELKSYTIIDVEDNTPKNKVTRHWDLLVSLAIAWAMRDEATSATDIADRKMKQIITNKHSFKR